MYLSFRRKVEGDRAALKGAISAQKALQGSDTETNEIVGRKEREQDLLSKRTKSPPTRGAIDFTFEQKSFFKSEQKKMSK